RGAMGKSRKYSKKRKNLGADVDDEPEFICTIDEQTGGRLLP
ncbi:unnamed protein product, partial [Microthlaspi erraticum]